MYGVFGINILRYVLVTVVFYFGLKWGFGRFKIQKKFPARDVIIQENLYSFAGLLVLSVTTVLALRLNSVVIPKIYYDYNAHSTGFHVLMLIVFMLYQDAYFYFVHRLLHTDFFYKRIHFIHHQFVNPTPFTFLAQHPLDLFMQSLGGFLFVFLVPMHPADLVINSFLLTLMNVYAHSGYEFFPAGFTRIPVLNLLSTSTNHNMHHSHNQCNYGLWFTVWDRIFGTLHPRYNDYFDQVKAQSAP